MKLSLWSVGSFAFLAAASGLSVSAWADVNYSNPCAPGPDLIYGSDSLYEDQLCAVVQKAVENQVGSQLNNISGGEDQLTSQLNLVQAIDSTTMSQATQANVYAQAANGNAIAASNNASLAVTFASYADNAATTAVTNLGTAGNGFSSIGLELNDVWTKMKQLTTTGVTAVPVGAVASLQTSYVVGSNSITGSKMPNGTYVRSNLSGSSAPQSCAPGTIFVGQSVMVSSSGQPTGRQVYGSCIDRASLGQ